MAKERMTGTPLGIRFTLFSSIFSYAREWGVSTAGCQPNSGRYRQYFMVRSDPLLPAWGGKWYAIISTFPKGPVSLCGATVIHLKDLNALVYASALLDPAMAPCVNPYLRRQRVAQEPQGTCRAAVRAGLKDSHEIPDFRFWKNDPARQRIKGRAKRPDDIHGVMRRRLQLAHQGDRIVALDGLAQIARGGQMMIHAAIDNEEFLPT